MVGEGGLLELLAGHRVREAAAVDHVAAPDDARQLGTRDSHETARAQVGDDAVREGAQLIGNGAGEVGGCHGVGFDHFHAFVWILAVLVSCQSGVTLIFHNFHGNSHFDLGRVRASYLERARQTLVLRIHGVCAVGSHTKNLSCTKIKWLRS